MLSSFLNFTRLKQVVYVLMVELLIMAATALVANSNPTFGKKLIEWIYDPIYFLFPEKFSFFLKSCLGLGCIFPNMTAWGILYLVLIGIILPILFAFAICSLLRLLAKRNGII